MAGLIIGIDASRMVITDTPTGIERVSNELIPRVVRELLQDEGVGEIWLYSSSSLDGIFDKYEFPRSRVKQKILRIPFRLFWTLCRVTLHFLNPFVRKPDVYWVPSHIFPLFLPFKTQGFQHIHDIAYKTYPGAYSWRSKLVLGLGMLVARIHKARFFYITNFTQQDVEKNYPWTKGRGVMAYLGWDHIGEKKDLDDSERSNYILYVSRLEEKKGTRFLLEGFDKLKEKLSDNGRYKDLNLVLVGKDGYGSEKVYETLDKMQYKEYVDLKGFVSEEDLDSYYRRALLMAIPSMYEGFGLMALEAFSYNLPLVSSNRSCMPEVAGDGALYFDPENTDEIALVLYKMLIDQNLCIDLVRKGRERLKIFSWDECGKKVANNLIR